MAFPITRYVEIKDRYCLCYFGWEEGYVRDLLRARESIESAFPELVVYLSFRDHFLYLAEGQPRILSMNQVGEMRHELAHVKEVKHGPAGNPVVQLLEESGVPVPEGMA